MKIIWLEFVEHFNIMFGSNKQLTLFTNISQKKNHFSAQHHPTSHLICDLKYKRSEITAYLVTVMLIKAFCPLFLLFSIRHHLLISAFEWPTWWIRSHHPGNCSRQEVKRNDCQWIKMATKKNAGECWLHEKTLKYSILLLYHHIQFLCVDAWYG